MKRLSTAALLVLILSAWTATVTHAESREIGDYIVHYNSLSSVLIPAKVAKSYQINRSHYRGLLNVTVLKKQPEGPPKPVEARVAGQAENLHNEVKPLKLREIREREAIYYIAEFPVSDGETLQFDITVTPPDGEPHRLQFENRFFVD